MSGHLKFVGKSLYGKQARLFWVDKDGEEIDISSVFFQASIKIDIDGLNTINLSGYLEEFEVAGIPELIDTIKRTKGVK